MSKQVEKKRSFPFEEELKNQYLFEKDLTHSQVNSNWVVIKSLKLAVEIFPSFLSRGFVKSHFLSLKFHVSFLKFRWKERERDNLMGVNFPDFKEGVVFAKCVSNWFNFCGV